MKHKKYREMIQLAYYGEITANEQVELERHLATCSRCEAEQAELNKFYRTISAYDPPKVGERDLVEARRALRMRLGGENKSEHWTDKVIEMISLPLVPRYRPVLAAAATLALGMGLGYYFFGAKAVPENGFIRTASEIDQTAFDQGEAQISNFRIVQKDEATGEVEFRFDATTPVRVKGNVKTDERVQKVLARAAVSAENPGTRLRAVATMAEHASGQQPVTNDVKTALISVAKYDENRGVRQEALKALERFLPDPDIVQVYIYVLKTEKNTGMKIAAINTLARMRLAGQPYSEDLLRILTEKVQSDENNYIRLKAKEALREVKQR
jgi:hypothetical protein